MPYTPHNECAKKMLEVPEGYRKISFKDNWDNGGPVILTIMRIGDEETVNENRRRLQETYHDMLDALDRKCMAMAQDE